MTNDEMLTVTIEFTVWEILRGRINILKLELKKIIECRDKDQLVYLAHDNAEIWNSGVDTYATVFVHPSGHHADDTIEII